MIPNEVMGMVIRDEMTPAPTFGNNRWADTNNHARSGSILDTDGGSVFDAV